MEQKHLKCLIFDFDGTLADTYHIIFELMENALKSRGINMSKNTDKLRGLGIRQLLKKYNISLIDLIFFARGYRKHLSNRIKEVKTFPGLRGVLKKLGERYDLGIVTSNSKENVEGFLRVNKLQNVFDFIETGSSVLGKNVRLSRTIRKHGYGKSEVVYVGDEVRDIEAAKKAGVRVAAVTWGYNSKSGLEKFKPDYLVTKPEQLLKNF